MLLSTSAETEGDVGGGLSPGEGELERLRVEGLDDGEADRSRIGSGGDTSPMESGGGGA